MGHPLLHLPPVIARSEAPKQSPLGAARPFGRCAVTTFTATQKALTACESLRVTEGNVAISVL
jgi:hypothetical protein